MPDRPDDVRTDPDPMLRGLAPRPAAGPKPRQEPPDTLIYDPGEDSPVESPAARAARRTRSTPAPPGEPADRPEVDRVAHFRVVGKIGEGGMGCVYRAVDEYLQRVVALKVLARSAASASEVENTQRLLREARAASRISHPNVVTIYAAGESEGHAFIAMEYVEGAELAGLVGRTGLDVERALAIAHQIALGLGAAHAQGLVHRDIKPANVVVCAGDRVKILDFGLAKPGASPDGRPGAAGADRRPHAAQFEPGLDVFKTQGGVVWGSLHYMSPEQACAEPLDARTDVFSLGVVLYQMLTGSLPFYAKRPADQLAILLGDEPDPLQNFSLRIPPSVQAVVDKALAKDRDLRYPDGDAMAADLATVLQRMRAFAGAEFDTAEARTPGGLPVRREPAPRPAPPVGEPSQARPDSVEYDRSYPRQLLAFHPDGSAYALTIATSLAFDWAPRSTGPDGKTSYGTAIQVRGEVYELVAVEPGGPGSRRYCFRHWPEAVVIRAVQRYTPQYVTGVIERAKPKPGISGVLSSLFGKRGAD